MYYCSTAIFLCLHTFSISRQLLETSAPASDGTPARVEISSNIPYQKQEDYSLLEFFNFGINNKLTPLEIGIVFCKQPCKIFCIHDKIWEPYFLSKHPWVPGYFLGPGMLSKQEIPVGEGWVDKLGQTLCSGVQTRAN